MSTGNDEIYLESTTPGLTWHLYTYKPERCEPYAVAIEGERSQNGFRYALSLGGVGGSRRIKLPLNGKRLTAKVKAAALVELSSKLREAGCIA